jgi:hypothetical protein
MSPYNAVDSANSQMALDFETVVKDFSPGKKDDLVVGILLDIIGFGATVVGEGTGVKVGSFH